MDLTPLRTSRDFRLLVAAGTVTFLGGMMTYVAVPYQVFRLTGSSLAVGLMGLAELIPLVVFGLYGGLLADRRDRRRVLVAATAAQAGLVVVLLVNAAVGPRLPVLYAVGALLSAAQAIQRPSGEALVPRVVTRAEIPAAAALSSVGPQVGMLAGPAVGGLLVAGPGATWCYAVDAVGLAVAAVLFAALRPQEPAAVDVGRPALAGLSDGLRYVGGRRDLLGTYVVDLVAMVMATPVTLFPAMATTVLHRPELLGLLYAAETVGALAVTLTSRWTARVRRQGRAIVLAAGLWCLATAAAGAAPSAAGVIACLVVAGAADMVSGLFREIVWNQSVPDDRRGLLAGLEMLSYSVGPLAGQVRAGLAADLGGVRRAIVGGGILGAVGVAGTAGAVRALWRHTPERTLGASP